jgi:hypothetical protein
LVIQGYTKRELEYLKQQPRNAAEVGIKSEGPTSTIEEKDEYFRLDLNSFMTVITLIAINDRKYLV